MITVLLVVGLVQSWLVRSGRSLFPWLDYSKLTQAFRRPDRARQDAGRGRRGRRARPAAPVTADRQPGRTPPPGTGHDAPPTGGLPYRRRARPATAAGTARRRRRYPARAASRQGRPPGIAARANRRRAATATHDAATQAADESDSASDVRRRLLTARLAMLGGRWLLIGGRLPAAGAARRPRPDVTFYGNRTAVDTGPTRWCEVDVTATGRCRASRPAAAGRPAAVPPAGQSVQINVPARDRRHPVGGLLPLPGRGRRTAGRPQRDLHRRPARLHPATVRPDGPADYVEVQSGFILMGGRERWVDFAATQAGSADRSRTRA